MKTISFVRVDGSRRMEGEQSRSITSLTKLESLQRYMFIINKLTTYPHYVYRKCDPVAVLCICGWKFAATANRRGWKASARLSRFVFAQTGKKFGNDWGLNHRLLEHLTDLTQHGPSTRSRFPSFESRSLKKVILRKKESVKVFSQKSRRIRKEDVFMISAVQGDDSVRTVIVGEQSRDISDV